MIRVYCFVDGVIHTLECSAVDEKHKPLLEEQIVAINQGWA